MFRFHPASAVNARAYRRAVLLAGAAGGVLAMSLATPREASAANECGSPSGGVVTCPVQDYPGGITYGTTTGLELHLTGGATVGGTGLTGPRGLVNINQSTGTGDVVLDATGVTLTGAGPQIFGAVVVNSGTGAAVITGGSYSASGAGASGAFARANAGTATVTVASASATGNGASGILAIGRDAVTVTGGTSSATGSATNPDGTVNPIGTVYVASIQAYSTTGSVTVHSGTASATGAGGNGVLATNDGTGAIVLDVTGDVTSAQAYGAYLAANGGGRITVDVAAGKTVAGMVAGINTYGSGGAAITNAGVIRQAGTDLDEDDVFDFAAINISANDVPTGSVVNNSGSILAADDYGIAVWFDSGDDVLNLSTGSKTVGYLIGADGFDTINLDGSIATKTTEQVFGAVHEFEQMNVNSGYWTLDREADIGNLLVAAGATLEVVENQSPTGDSGIGGVGDAGTLTAIIDGKLRLVAHTSEPFLTGLYVADQAAAWWSGSFSGSGSLEIDRADLTYLGGDIDLAGGTTILSGSSLLAGTLSGPVTVAAGASLTVGASLVLDTVHLDENDDPYLFTVGGPGASGTLSSGATNNGLLVFNRTGALAYSGLKGSGDAVQAGGGKLTLTGYAMTGTTELRSGTLDIAGAAGADIKARASASSTTATGPAVKLAATGAGGDAELAVDAGVVLQGQTFGANLSSASGNVTIRNSGTVKALNAAAANGAVLVEGGTYASTAVRVNAVLANGAATTVNVASATSSGDGASGIFAIGRDSVTVTGGTTTTTGSATDPDGTVNPVGTVYVAGIQAYSTAGSVTVHSGVVSSTGEGGTGVLATTDGTGTVVLDVTGDITSTQAYGAYLGANGGGRITVGVGAGKTVSGMVAGINTVGSGGATITNAGVIRQTGTDLDEDDAYDFAAINIADGGVPAGSILNNSGSILAKDQDGIAVWFDAGDDVLNLSTGSTIVGQVIGADGLDTVNLAGSSNARSAQQVLGHIYEFETLNANAGYWTMTGPTQADTVNVAAGATLEMYERRGVNEAYIDAPSGALTFNLAGRLVIDSDDDKLYPGAESLRVTGTGALDLKGGAQLQVASAWTNTGQLTIFTGSKVLVTGSLASDVTVNAGGTLQIGAALAADPHDADLLVVTGPGTTGEVTGDIHVDGALTLNRSNDFTLAGALSGMGDLYLTGGGTVTIAGLYTFGGTTHRQAGQLKLASVDSEGEFEVGDGAVIDLSGGDQTVGGLSGQGEIVVNDGSLTIAQEPGQTSTFAGSISGDGDLNVSGGGVLDLTGDSTYTGDTVVTGGSTVKVNGSITSDVVLGDGGTLGGSGEIAGDVGVGDGGVFSPGNSPGVTTVAGDVSFAAGSTYTFEVDNGAVPANDLIQITGAGQAIISGGTLAVQAAGTAGDYDRRTVYTAITAEGGVTGAGFDAVTSSQAFLTPYLRYGAEAVDVVLVNNTISLATVGVTSNQVATAGALNAAGAGAVLYDAVAPQDDDGVRQAADALSGEAYATQNAVLMQQASQLRRTFGKRLAEEAEGGAVWIEVYDRSGEIDAATSLAGADTGATGLLVGVEGDMGAWRAGASLSYLQSDLDVGALGSRLQADTFEAGGYAGTRLGAWRLSLSAAYASHTLDARRNVAFAGFAQTLAAGYDAVTAQASAEVAYALAIGPFRVEPFAGVGFVSLDTDGFNETGGSAALTVAGQSQQATVALLGLRVAGEVAAGGGSLSPRASVAWRAASGDTQGASTGSFGAGPAFTVRGADLLDETVELGFGFDWSRGPVSVGLSYDGEIGENASQHGATLRAALRF